MRASLAILAASPFAALAASPSLAALAAQGYDAAALAAATLPATGSAQCFAGLCSDDPAKVSTAASCPYATSLCSAPGAAQENPWVQIDMGARRTVEAVAVYGRKLGAHTVVVADDPHFLHTTACVAHANGGKLAPEVSRCAGAGVAGRFVRLVLTGAARTLDVAKLEVFVNGARAPAATSMYEKAVVQSATMSSTWSPQCVATNCVDGKRDSPVAGCETGASLCHTAAHTADPWLQLDLGSVKRVIAAAIYNRIGSVEHMARLGHHQLLVSHDPSFKSGVFLCHQGTAAASAGPFVEPCVGFAQGRYVRLLLPGTARTLNIRELEVFTHALPAQPATCVDDASYRCGHFQYGPRGKCVAGLAKVTEKCCSHCWDYVMHDTPAQPALVLPGCSCDPATHPVSTTTACAEKGSRMQVTAKGREVAHFARPAHYHKCAFVDARTRLTGWALRKKKECRCCDCVNPFYAHRTWANNGMPIPVAIHPSNPVAEPAFTPAGMKGKVAPIERPVSGSL